jgi:tetratricopeptide (TPR) repeat protein
MTRFRRTWFPVIGVALVSIASAMAGTADLDRARQFYQQTKYQEALQSLEGQSARSGDFYELIGKCYYMLGEYKKATEALEKAIQKDTSNSDYFDWLGKIYGKRAETSSFVTAWSYAGKCQKNFERAIELEPKNLDAIDDLFEFALDAPGFVGGGLDKAAAVSDKAREVNPAKYHSMKARLAEKQKDYAGEEKHLQEALEIAPSHLGRIIDMAEFLARRGRFEESEAMFERGRKIAPGNAQLKFERAKTYIQTGRNRAEARKLLKEYVESSLTADDPPRADAEELLKRTNG